MQQLVQLLLVHHHRVGLDRGYEVPQGGLDVLHRGQFVPRDQAAIPTDTIGAWTRLYRIFFNYSRGLFRHSLEEFLHLVLYPMHFGPLATFLSRFWL